LEHAGSRSCGSSPAGTWQRSPKIIRRPAARVEARLVWNIVEQHLRLLRVTIDRLTGDFDQLA
jgi:hypothetical protein